MTMLTRGLAIFAVFGTTACFPTLQPDAGNITRPAARSVEPMPVTNAPGTLPEGRSSCAEFENAVITPAGC